MSERTHHNPEPGPEDDGYFEADLAIPPTRITVQVEVATELPGDYFSGLAVLMAVVDHLVQAGASPMRAQLDVDWLAEPKPTA